MSRYRDQRKKEIVNPQGNMKMKKSSGITSNYTVAKIIASLVFSVGAIIVILSFLFLASLVFSLNLSDPIKLVKSMFPIMRIVWFILFIIALLITYGVLEDETEKEQDD